MTILLLGIGEIKDLKPEHKNKLEEAYLSAYTGCLVTSIGALILQLYVYFVGYAVDFLLKRTKEDWQLFFLLLALGGAFYINKRFELFKKENNQENEKK